MYRSANSLLHSSKKSSCSWLSSLSDIVYFFILVYFAVKINELLIYEASVDVPNDINNFDN